MRSLLKKIISGLLFVAGCLVVVWASTSLEGLVNAAEPAPPALNDPNQLLNAGDGKKSAIAQPPAAPSVQGISATPPVQSAPPTVESQPSPPSPPQQSSAPPPQPPAQKPTVLNIPGFVMVENYTYDPTGLRDPFKPHYSEPPQPQQPQAKVEQKPVVQEEEYEEFEITDPLQAFELSQLKVVGIVWGTSSPRAMIKDPKGKLHMIKKNSKIGRKNGFVAAVREGEVVVVEPVRQSGVMTALTKVMLLTRE